MSAAGRGSTRLPRDNYPTPAWAVRRLLEAWQGPLPEWILEPFAGEGAMVRELRAWAPKATIEAWDVRSESVLGEPLRQRLKAAGANLKICGRDALREGLEWPARPGQLIISNPPFALAEAACLRALACAGSSVAMLERVGFAAGPRAKWMRKTPPDVALLGSRPSFADKLECRDGCAWAGALVHPEAPAPDCPVCGAAVSRRAATDAIEYAWFCWPAEGRERQAGRVYWLGETSPQERKRN